MPRARHLQLPTPVAGALVPASCGGCGALLPAAHLGGPWCSHCRDRWGPVPGRWSAGPEQCPGWAAAVYGGRVRRAVLEGKYGAPLAVAGLLVHRCPAEVLPAAAVVSWVPAHPRRAVRVGDTGRVLASALARQHGLPLARVLWRTPWARRQAGRTVSERRADPQRIGLRAVGRAPLTVVLVDDVRTSGTTLDHAARLLRAAGASEVVGVTVAMAPERDHD